MDFIPAFKFVVALMMFGFLFYIYDPVITYMKDGFYTAGGAGIDPIYGQFLFWVWGILAAIVLFGNGIKMVMEYQKKGPGVRY